MKKETKDSSARKETGCCSSIEAGGPATFSRVRRILVPVDFSEDSERALRCATCLAERCGASINLVYGAESMDALKNEAADLIVISTGEQRGQSAAEQVVRAAPCPVLVVRRNRTLRRCELRFRGQRFHARESHVGGQRNRIGPGRGGASVAKPFDDLAASHFPAMFNMPRLEGVAQEVEEHDCQNMKEEKGA